MTSHTIREAEDHFCAARQAQRDGVSACQSLASTNSCQKRLDFFSCITLSPDLSGVSDPIPYLQIFTARVRVGTLEANGAGVKKRTAEVYLCDMV